MVSENVLFKIQTQKMQFEQFLNPFQITILTKLGLGPLWWVGVTPTAPIRVDLRYSHTVGQGP